MPKIFFFPKNCHWYFFLEKMIVFGNFLENVKFLAIFWHSNSYFPEGQVCTMPIWHLIYLAAFSPCLTSSQCWVRLVRCRHRKWKLCPNTSLKTSSNLINKSSQLRSQRSVENTIIQIGEKLWKKRIVYFKIDYTIKTKLLILKPNNWNIFLLYRWRIEISDLTFVSPYTFVQISGTKGKSRRLEIYAH